MKKLLVRHAAGEAVYDTLVFRTEDKTGVLLVFDDPAQKRLLAAFNSEFWIAAEFIDVKEVDDAGEVQAET